MFVQPFPRKAKKLVEEPSKIDKTVIVLESLPFGEDNAETQVHPMMEDLAANFTVEEPVPPAEIPTAPVATWT